MEFAQKFYPRKNLNHKIRKLFNLKKDDFLIGHLARFHPIKGHKILLKSLKLSSQKIKILNV